MKTSGQGWQRRFTLIELLVVVAIISVLASMLMPVLGKARGKARATVCTNNLKQISMMMALYHGDNDDSFPWASEMRDLDNDGDTEWWEAVTWDDQFTVYDGRGWSEDRLAVSRYNNTINTSYDCRVYRCPNEVEFGGYDARKHIRMRSYSIASRGVGNPGGVWQNMGVSNNFRPGSTFYPTFKVGDVPDTTSTLMLAELRDDSQNVMGGGQNGNLAHVKGPKEQGHTFTLLPWHDNQWNYVFVDGHAASMDPYTTYGTGTPTDARGMWTLNPKD